MTICLHNGILLNGISIMEKCAVLLENKKILDVFSEERFYQKQFDSDVKIIDVKNAYIAPGLIDTHIHGFKGHGTDNCTTDDILKMSEDLAGYGVTAFNPTMYSASEDRMIDGIKNIVAAMGHETGAQIMGIHLEGPFISPEKLGVQRPETVHNVDLSLMERLWEASRGHIVNMTVAPELKHMRQLALYCLSKEIILQDGHTDASYNNVVEGMQAGILHATHLFNAMSQMQQRNPGVVGAVLIHPEMSCEIIADGVHVHPDLFKLLLRDKTSDQIVLVTDALTPTEQTGSPLYANGEEVVFEDGCFHRKADGVIAGSALTLLHGVSNFVKFGSSIQDAIKCATANPARIMRYKKKGMLIPGYDSDVIVFTDKYELRLVIARGEIITPAARIKKSNYQAK